MTNAITKFPPALPKLVKLLATDNDSKCLAAARELGKALRSAGCDFHDLANAIERGEAIRRDERHEPPEDDWRNLVDWCRARGERLSEREPNSLAEMCDWIGEPSAKQVAWLEAIANKLRRARWLIFNFRSLQMPPPASSLLGGVLFLLVSQRPGDGHAEERLGGVPRFCHIGE